MKVSWLMKRILWGLAGLAILALLLLPCYSGLVAMGVGPPSGVTITPISTPVVDFAACRTAESESSRIYHPSPDVRFCAAETNGGFFLVMAAADGRRAGISWSKWLRFRGWSESGRFGLFERRDQYSNRLARTFDTATWSEISFPVDDSYCFGSMSGSCQLGLAAIAPLTERVLLSDGQLTTLPDLAAHQLLAGVDRPFVHQAAWSPDERYLAFVAAELPEGPVDWSAVVLRLYLADGDGQHAQLLPAELDETVVLEWATVDGRLLVSTQTADYSVDPLTGAVETRPAN